jgi:hypothetical protein
MGTSAVACGACASVVLLELRDCLFVFFFRGFLFDEAGSLIINISSKLIKYLNQNFKTSN